MRFHEYINAYFPSKRRAVAPTVEVQQKTSIGFDLPSMFQVHCIVFVSNNCKLTSI